MVIMNLLIHRYSYYSRKETFSNILTCLYCSGEFSRVAFWGYQTTSCRQKICKNLASREDVLFTWYVPSCVACCEIDTIYWI